MEYSVYLVFKRFLVFAALRAYALSRHKLVSVLIFVLSMVTFATNLVRLMTA